MSQRAVTTPPGSLGPAGRDLWRQITRTHPTIDGVQQAHLEAACRARDMIARLTRVADSPFVVMVEAGDEVVLRVDAVLNQLDKWEANLTSALASMRLPVGSPSRSGRQGPRGPQSNPAPVRQPRVSALDAARQKREAV